VCFWADLGTGFAFSHNSVLKPVHVLHESHAEYEVCGILISDQLNPKKLLYELEVFGTAQDLDDAAFKWCKVDFGGVGGKQSRRES
jgi:hypothetical protein